MGPVLLDSVYLLSNPKAAADEESRIRKRLRSSNLNA